MSSAAATTLADDTTETSSSEADCHQAELDFAKCLRDHGLDWPHPIFDPAGGPARVDVGPDVNSDDRACLSAYEACTAETSGMVDAP